MPPESRSQSRRAAGRGTPLSSPAGLCETCAQRRLVPNTRGSVFYLCERSRSEPERYPRYPRLPVRDCPGYEPQAGSA